MVLPSQSDLIYIGRAYLVTVCNQNFIDVTTKLPVYSQGRRNESKTGCVNYLKAKKVGAQNFHFHYLMLKKVGVQLHTLSIRFLAPVENQSLVMLLYPYVLPNI